MDYDILTQRAVDLLSQLISIQSFSKEEDEVAKVIVKELESNGYRIHRKGNNIWAFCKDYKEGRPTLMMNSHLDTVKPSSGWETDPFDPIINEGKLFGLGSNDAGGCLITLLLSFIANDENGLAFNRVFVATAEEEISGPGGIASVLTELGDVSCGIVGEPTQMEMAIAEKGLMVLDCDVEGKAGHAARTGGINAITEAFKEIEWFHSFQFPENSKVLGPVKMTVTVINAGKQHNVIPAKCSFVVDVRLNECYSNKSALEIIQKSTKAKVTPRSLRMNSSGIPSDHPLVIAGKELSIVQFGSPTTSDQALITIFPTIKMGPGDSNRSHTANEFIHIEELKQGLEIYTSLLHKLKL